MNELTLGKRYGVAHGALPCCHWNIVIQTERDRQALLDTLDDYNGGVRGRSCDDWRIVVFNGSTERWEELPDLAPSKSRYSLFSED